MAALADLPKLIDHQPSLSERVIMCATIPSLGLSQGTTAVDYSSRRPHLATVPARLASMEWFRPTWSQFESVLALPDGWDSYGGAAPSFASVQRALIFLAGMLDASANPPAVVPTGDGGIQLVWKKNGVDVEATFSAHDEPEIYVRDVDGGEFEGDLTAPQAIAAFRGVLARLRD